MIRVLLVDDHVVVTEGLAMLLGAFDDLDVVGNANGGEEAVERFGELRPDVVLMDLSMPGVDGLEATRRLVQVDPGARIIALTAFVEGDLVTQAMAAGASGYLLKSAGGEELRDAIRAVANGQSILSDRALRLLTTTPTAEATGHDLTPRERDVLAPLARGLSNKQIASDLGLQPGTVRIYVSSILAKLAAENRTAAAHIARTEGLV